MKKLQNKEKGFTIIEVLIVLAIAGLILLIVFLAVPALQRNSRNTQRKNDVSGLLGAVNEYTSNNNGALPTTAAQILSNTTPGYYTSGAGSAAGQVNIAAGTQAALGTTPANDRAVVVTGATCGTAGATAPGSARQVAVQYLVETQGGFQAVCQAS